MKLKETPKYKDLVKVNDTTWKYKDKVTIGYNEYGKYYFVSEPSKLDWMYSSESLKDLLNSINNELKDEVDESMRESRREREYDVIIHDIQWETENENLPSEIMHDFFLEDGQDISDEIYNFLVDYSNGVAPLGYEVEMNSEEYYYQPEEEYWDEDAYYEESLLKEDKDTYFDFKQKLTNAKTLDELQKVWGVIKSSINQLEDKEADKLFAIYKSLKDVLNESLKDEVITKDYIIKRLALVGLKNSEDYDIYDYDDKYKIVFYTAEDRDEGFGAIAGSEKDRDDWQYLYVRKNKINESLKEDYKDDKEYITLPEDEQKQFEQLMNANGWILDDETARYGSKNFYDAWFHKEGDGAQDIHYQFITTQKFIKEDGDYDTDKWDEVMDNTFDLLDECEKEFNTRIRFSAGLIKDGRGTIGIDIDAPELVIKGEDKVRNPELAGHKVRLKNGKPHGKDSEDVIKDIEDHGFDVRQMGIKKKDESLKEAKVNYVKTDNYGKYGTEVKIYSCEGDEITPKGFTANVNGKTLNATTLDELEKNIINVVNSEDKKADNTILNDSLKEARDYKSEYNITPSDKKKIIQWWKDVDNYYKNTGSKSYVSGIDEIDNTDEIDGWLDTMYDVLSELVDEKKDSLEALQLLRRGKALFNKYSRYSYFNYGVKENKCK